MGQFAMGPTDKAVPSFSKRSRDYTMAGGRHFQHLLRQLIKFS